MQLLRASWRRKVWGYEINMGDANALKYQPIQTLRAQCVANVLWNCQLWCSSLILKSANGTPWNMKRLKTLGVLKASKDFNICQTPWSMKSTWRPSHLKTPLAMLSYDTLKHSSDTLHALKTIDIEYASKVTDYQHLLSGQYRVLAL